MAAQAAVLAREDVVGRTRPEISVYWKPGCSSCLKTKEFVEEQGLEFESVNVLENEAGLKEVMDSGLRSIPAVRKGARFVYAQSLDDIASFLGVSFKHERLSNQDLFDRWDVILTKASVIFSKFSDAQFHENVIPGRNRSILGLSVHVGQIVHAFLKQLNEGVTEIQPIQAYVDPKITTSADVLAHLAKEHTALREWRASGRDRAIPKVISTDYGTQPGAQVLERAVWHCAQHVRQLDIIAAGRLGAELEIPTELYAGLPLPKRLWV